MAATARNCVTELVLTSSKAYADPFNDVEVSAVFTDPYGPSPHGMSWGDTPWPAAAELAGSAQVGLGRRILERYDWWRLEPSADLVSPRWTPQDYLGPYAATIPGQCHIIYLPQPGAVTTVRLTPGGRYRGLLINPATGREYDLGDITPAQDGSWTPPAPVPVYHDLVLVIEIAAEAQAAGQA